MEIGYHNASNVTNLVPVEDLKEYTVPKMVKDGWKTNYDSAYDLADIADSIEENVIVRLEIGRIPTMYYTGYVYEPMYSFKARFAYEVLVAHYRTGKKYVVANRKGPAVWQSNYRGD